MKIAGIFTVFALLNGFLALSKPAHAFRPDEFPEEREYSPTERGFGRYSAKSLRNKNQVVLTFDDGPSPTLTPQVLDVLKRHNTRATFFIIGSHINSKTAPIIARAIREGHTVGTHTENHYNSNRLTEAQFKKEVRSPILALYQVMEEQGVTQNEVYFRYPGGNYGNVKHDSDGNPIEPYNQMNSLRDLSYDLFGANCINFAFWTVDTEDWVPGRTTDEVLENIDSSLYGGLYHSSELVNGKYHKIEYKIPAGEAVGGGVILMHDIHTPSVDGLERILTYLEEKNIEVLRLKDVEEYRYGDRKCNLLDHWRTWEKKR